MYNPPVRNPTKTITWLALVSQADPDFAQAKYREPERYEDSARWGRPRFVNPNTRGPYNDHSNVYTVGQPFGGDDAVKVAAKAPTVGNTVPGLYEGSATGSWA